MSTNRNTLNGDLYILNDPNNPNSSRSSNINPSTTLDQVYDQNDIDTATAKYKTLRKILEELETLITQGGDIVFPVTSVNGHGMYNDHNSDVVLTAADLNLENVENVTNDERPLGSLAASQVENLIHQLLDTTLETLINHVKSQNNPHGINIDTINSDGSLTNLIAKMITDHINDDTDPLGHPVLRELIRELSNIIHDENIGNEALSARITTANNALNDHKTDNSAHATIFSTKEDIAKKVNEIIEEEVSGTDGKYPTVYAVVEYIKKLIAAYSTPYDIVSQIKVVGPGRDVESLPDANKEEHDKKIIYILPDGHNDIDGKMEMATIVEQNADTNPTYVWKYTLVGPYSTYDAKYFYYDSARGLTINIEDLITDIFTYPGKIQEAITDIVNIIIADDLSNYYTKQDINNMGLVGGLEFTPGPSAGTVTLKGYNYDNDGKSVPFVYTVAVTGLGALAFKNQAENADIADGAISNEKIGTKEITGDKVADTTITADNLSLPYNHIFANMFDEENNRVEPIEVHWFADFVINRFIEYFDFSVIDDQTIIEDVARIFAIIVGESDPTNTINFYINEDGELIMQFPGVYAEYQNPDAKIEGDDLILYLDDDETKVTIIDKILSDYEFYVDGDNLYLKVPISYATLKELTVE